MYLEKLDGDQIMWLSRNSNLKLLLAQLVKSTLFFLDNPELIPADEYGVKVADLKRDTRLYAGDPSQGYSVCGKREDVQAIVQAFKDRQLDEVIPQGYGALIAQTNREPKSWIFTQQRPWWHPASWLRRT